MYTKEKSRTFSLVRKSVCNYITVMMLEAESFSGAREKFHDWGNREIEYYLGENISLHGVRETEVA